MIQIVNLESDVAPSTAQWGLKYTSVGVLNDRGLLC